MKTSNRTKATLGLFGAAAIAGVALTGGLTDGVEPAGLSSAAPATASASASAGASRAASAASASASNAAARIAAAGTAGGAAASAGTNASSPASTGTAQQVASTSGADGPGGSVVLVLDSSRSMRTVTTGSTTRMDEAKAAMSKVIASLPADARVGLRVYGSSVTVNDPLVPSAQACRDSRAVVPLGPVDKPRLQAVASVFKPFGYTPTSYALEQAAADLGASGKRTIILVSDGEESCPVDPAATAKRLRGQGIDLTINTVGLHANQAARTQLQEVATNGGGTYASAGSASELENGLQGILQRMRSANGTGSNGTGSNGTGSNGTGSNDGGSTGSGTNGSGGNVTGGDVAVGAASTGDQHVTSASTGSGSRAIMPAGFVSALLLLILFLWLADHR